MKSIYRNKNEYISDVKYRYVTKVLVIACLCLFLIVLFHYDPITTLWMPKCPFYLITGLRCPGCGLQRALHALLQGRWLEAIHYNYFIFVILPYISLLIAQSFYPFGKEKRNLEKKDKNKRFNYWCAASAFIWLVLRNFLKI